MHLDTENKLTAHVLARFVARTGTGDIPDAILDRAALSVLDTLAAAVGGSATPNADAMRAAATNFFGDGNSPLWFTGKRGHRATAILANCAAASALDIDDGHRGASGHAGAAIVPAVLQEAADKGHEGREILAAIALGYDVALRVASARRPGTVKCFSSGRWCGFGVAAAIGWLRRLDASRMAHAITIAGAEAPENLPAGSYRRMSSVKGSSPWSTLTAFLAVDRATCDAAGPDDSLDRADVYDPASIVAGLGSEWFIGQTYMKPYASCRYTHPSIDAVLEMTRARRPALDEIEDLSVEIFPEAFTITNERAPGTLESAQFSIPFCLALATLRGASAFRPMREEHLQDHDVLALAQRVRMSTGADFKTSFPAMTPSRVKLTLKSGATEAVVRHPLGDVDNPLPRPDIEAKFHDLATDVLDEPQRDRVLHAIDDLRRGRADRLLAAIA